MFNKRLYFDHRHLTLKGKLRAPARVTVNLVELCLVPDFDLPDWSGKSYVPQAVGGLHLNQGLLTGYLSLPEDALPAILQMLIADRFRYVVLHGDKLRYRRASVRSYRMEMTLDEAEYPD